MAALAWTPWRRTVELRDDLKSGELAMWMFAADLYEVVMRRARTAYQDPKEFFALTYPTYNLRELARAVIGRLAGHNDEAVRLLALTYGGGKTHALVTLLHLVSDPEHLPDLPAVREFRQHIGVVPPKTRVAVLPFDKLDPEKGMEVRAPNGETRWLKQPWSVMAYEIAGSEGLRLLHPDGVAEERSTAPFENLLLELLGRPGREGLATLVLVDEVLMWAREKVRQDAGAGASIVNFFQGLTQAGTKVPRCAIVASLLPTDPAKMDDAGNRLAADLEAVFRRVKEQDILPVEKQDVAEVLRRRLFTPASVQSIESFRPHVVAALKAIGTLDEQTKRDGKAAEDRYLHSYPFHPDLTEVLYGKWTNLSSFQRTRGVLRTFALALRQAVKWDDAPLVGPGVFLSAPDTDGLSDAARELAGIAATEAFDGPRQAWPQIVDGELGKARQVQGEFAGLRHREIEQAVFATFLHSQPIGQKAQLRDLLVLVSPTRPDQIELRRGLRRWTELSWFLDEGEIAELDGEAASPSSLPKAWRLGSRPNLRQMHHAARENVGIDVVDARLIDEIQRTKALSDGARNAGAIVHVLPPRPRDIDDDGQFHYAVLGPQAASESGAASREAERFLTEKTGSDSPRVYKNALVLAVPSKDGLDAARLAVREYLAWEEVKAQLQNQEKDQPPDPVRKERLEKLLGDARRRIPDAIRHAYCVVVTTGAEGKTQAFRMSPSADQPLFLQIKADARSRIQDTAITAEALLPGGPYELWKEGETRRWVKDLVGAFAQFPHLPKMLRQAGIVETLVRGVREGTFVLRLERPDHSVRTFWRQEPEEQALKEPGLELILPEGAELAGIPSTLLAPEALPGLWSGPQVSVAALRKYFGGGTVVPVPRGGFEEPTAIPSAPAAVVDDAVRRAVREAKLWLTSGPASLLAEDIPAGILTEAAMLQAPPRPVGALELLPEALPDAWHDGVTSATGLLAALSTKAGSTLPWAIVRDAISGAVQARYLEVSSGPGTWPCELAGAATVNLRITGAEKPGPVPPPRPGVLVAQADLKVHEVQELAEQFAAISKAALGLSLRLHVVLELEAPTGVPSTTVDDINALLGQVKEGLKLN